MAADLDGTGGASAVVTEPADAAKPVEVAKPVEAKKRIPGALMNGPRSGLGRKQYQDSIAHLGRFRNLSPSRYADAAAERIAEARRLVARQEALIANLMVAKRPTADAEAALFNYLSTLRHLEDHERKIKHGLKTRIGVVGKKQQRLHDA